jgi:hypothetical protein
MLRDITLGAAMAKRNLGLMSRASDGGIILRPAQSRAAAAHEPLKPIQLAGISSRPANYRNSLRSGLSTPERNQRELITMCVVMGFVLFFGGCIALAFLAAVMIVDWVGVAETAFRVFDFG